MALREQQLFTLDEVASCLKESIGYVNELLRARAFKYVIIEHTSPTGGDWTGHYYFDESLWPYKGKLNAQGEPSIREQEAWNNYHYLMPALRDFGKDIHGETDYLMEFVGPDKWLEDAKKISVPRASMEDIKLQLEANLTPSDMSSWNSLSSFLRTIKSDRLRAALSAYHEFYVCNKIEAKKGHSAQIQEWLKQRYGRLSNREVQSIAAVVNLDQRRPKK